MIDSLTELPNMVGLLDWINGLSDPQFSFPFSLVAIQLPALWQVNRLQGRAAGDELLRSCAKTLKGNHSGPIFRAGGDKFAVLLDGGEVSKNVLTAQRLAAAINPGKMLPSLPPARVAVIHFRRKKDFTPGNILASLFVSLADRCQLNAGGQPVEFEASAICAMEEYPWMMIDLAEQMMRLGNAAESSRRLAHTDSVSQLPNLRAALEESEAALALAWKRNEPLSILLIDGDNLRQFNSVSYEAGDEAIRLIGAALQQQLRETDFLARYRTGDEFLILLRNTPKDKAQYIAQRLCWAVERSSNAWLFHTTISIGVAVYPEHGDTVQDLLHTAESGLDLAKEQGKNRVKVCTNKNQ